MRWKPAFTEKSHHPCKIQAGSQCETTSNNRPVNTKTENGLPEYLTFYVYVNLFHTVLPGIYLRMNITSRLQKRTEYFNTREINRQRKKKGREGNEKKDD
jgi:hypothetical protein